MALGGVLAALLGDGRAEPTNRFGFTGPEIFPIDPLITQLAAADLDGDGDVDLVVANNSRSKISLLYNQTGQTNRTDGVADSRKDLNQLPPDARFRLESIASEKRIANLVVGDLNGDGRPDLAYYGEPKELIAHYNQGAEGWSAPKRWNLDDGLLNAEALARGDLNGDGRPDLALLGESAVYFLPQREGTGLGEPERLPYAGSVKALQIQDIDGDGRDDLLLVNWDDPNPFRFRLQDSSGQLGPEVHLTMPPLRAYLAEELNQDHRMEVVAIAQKSGRATVATFRPRPGDELSGAFRAGQFQLLALNKTAKTRRGVAWGDVNGDRRPDLLVAEPESGQLNLFLQQDKGALGAPRTFPSLTGVSEIEVADWDGDGRPEIFLLSADERQVGVTSYDPNGRLAFPRIVSIPGRPWAMAVGAIHPGGPTLLATIVEQDAGRVLHLLPSTGGGTTQKLSEGFKSNPTRLAIFDANQDRLPDLVVLIPYEKIRILVQRADRTFEEVEVAPPGGNAEQPWLSRADVDGDGAPELLLAQKNFVRAVVLQSEAPGGSGAWTFTVKEQINGAGSNSKIVGAAALPNGDQPIPSLFLLDAERKALTLCERDTAGVWQVVRNHPLPVTAFTALEPLTLGGSDPNAVAFLSSGLVGWMNLHGEVWDSVELDGYETPVKDGSLNKVVAGDLNHDGTKDLVFLETAKNHVDLVVFRDGKALEPALRWPVFEERTFRSRRSEIPEPREALVADVTGDGKRDLVVLVHDRILLYPQE